MPRTPPASTPRGAALSKGCPPAASSAAVTLIDLYFKFQKCHTRRPVDLGERRRRQVRLPPGAAMPPSCTSVRTEAHVLLFLKVIAGTGWMPLDGVSAFSEVARNV